jgi:tetratricopeptide (TPR) repeat protein
VLGFVQTGPQIAADRYTYLACLPWALVAGAAVYRLRRTPRATALVAAAALAVLGMLTVRQTRVWRDSRTLWEHVLRVDPGNYVAYTNRGFLEQDPRRAIADYDRALRLNPRYRWPGTTAGGAARAGDFDSAIADCSEPSGSSPGIKAWNNRGWARQAKGDWAGAAADYAGLALAPADWNGRALIEGNLATARRRLGAPPP